jgi:ankyrin repeat protein
MLVKFCDNLQDATGNTALHTAIVIQFDDAVELLTAVGVQFDFRLLNGDGFTVLHQAAQCNYLR